MQGSLVTRQSASAAATAAKGYGRPTDHFKAQYSPRTKGILAQYQANLSERNNNQREVTLDTRALKDLMEQSDLSVIIDDSEPMHAGREVLVTKLGFFNPDGTKLDFTCFQVTIPLALGWGHNFKFFANGTNGPRMYVN